MKKGFILTFLKEKGFVGDTMNAIQALFVAMGVLILTIILISILGGKAFTTVQSDITGIYDASSSDDNSLGALDIRGDVNSSIVNSFEGLNQATTFLPLIVLAVVFGLILFIIGGQMFAGGRR